MDYRVLCITGEISDMYDFHVYVNGIYLGLICDVILGECVCRPKRLSFYNENGGYTFTTTCDNYYTINENGMISVYITK